MKILIGIVLAIAIVVTGLLVYSNSSHRVEQNNSQSISPTATPSPTQVQNTMQIPADYKKYESSEYSIYYHPEMEVRNEAPGITSFVLVGPTQKGQTELYDGIIFSIQSGNYTQNTLRDFIDSEVEQFKKDGVTQITSGVISVIIGNKTGYEFSTRSLGEVRQIYLDKGNKEFIHVTLLVDDPSNAGFDEVVNHMFQGLTFK